jgi:hypothetical protein
MTQKQKMTTEERLDVIMKADEYLEAGNKAEPSGWCWDCLCRPILRRR